MDLEHPVEVVSGLRTDRGFCARAELLVPDGECDEFEYLAALAAVCRLDEGVLARPRGRGHRAHAAVLGRFRTGRTRGGVRGHRSQERVEPNDRIFAKQSVTDGLPELSAKWFASNEQLCGVFDQGVQFPSQRDGKILEPAQRSGKHAPDSGGFTQ